MNCMLVVIVNLSFIYAVVSKCDSWYDHTTHGPSFVNVKDFGAKGDGITDDTLSIQSAIDHNRGDVLAKSKAVVYLPPGKYIVNDTLVLWYATHFMGSISPLPECSSIIMLKNNTKGYGNAGSLKPVIATVCGFNQPRSAHAWWLAEHGDSDNNMNFYTQLHNIQFILGYNPGATGVFWAVAQGTSIRNITIDAKGAFSGLDVGRLPKYAAMNGSFTSAGGGGTIEGVRIIGGQYSIRASASQWFFRSIYIIGSSTKVGLLIDNQAWSFVFLDLHIESCDIGIKINDHAANNIHIIDSHLEKIISGVAIYVVKRPIGLMLSRVRADRLKWIVQDVLPGNSSGTMNVMEWRLDGNAYVNNQKQPGTSGDLTPSRFDKEYPLRWRPSFTNGPVPYNVRNSGALGNCKHDDTDALQDAINHHTAVFLPIGCYRVSKTVELKSNTIIVGEGLAIVSLAPNSKLFGDEHAPRPVLNTPNNATGTIILADLILSAEIGNRGAILLQWRVGFMSSIFDLHARLYQPVHDVVYITGNGGGYISNSWVWGADHNLTDDTEMAPLLNSSSGWLGGLSGIRIDSAGPTFLYGTASEHHRNIQYNLTSARKVTMLNIQTENPYWIKNNKGTPACDAKAIVISNTSNEIEVMGMVLCSWFCTLSNDMAIVANGAKKVNILGGWGSGSKGGLLGVVKVDGTLLTNYPFQNALSAVNV